MELTRVRQRRQLPLLLRQLASQTGQVLNIAKAVTAIGMDKSTAENYTGAAGSSLPRAPARSLGNDARFQIGAAPKSSRGGQRTRRAPAASDREQARPWHPHRPSPSSTPATRRSSWARCASSSAGSICPCSWGTGGHTTATRSTWSSNAKTARSPPWR